MFLPDRLEFHPSNALVWLISVLHLFAALGLLFADLDMLLLSILWTLLVVSWLQLLRRYALLTHGDSPVYLRWDQDGWYAVRRAEPDIEYQVLPDGGCRLWPRWNLLRFRAEDTSIGVGFTQLVLSDVDNQRAIRRLRVLLRLLGSSRS